MLIKGAPPWCFLQPPQHSVRPYCVRPKPQGCAAGCHPPDRYALALHLTGQRETGGRIFHPLPLEGLCRILRMSQPPQALISPHWWGLMDSDPSESEPSGWADGRELRLSLGLIRLIAPTQTSRVCSDTKIPRENRLQPPQKCCSGPTTFPVIHLV